MPCFPLIFGGQDEAVGTICFTGATRVVKQRPLGVRWCFKCRQRVEFEFTLTATVEPSYYGPTPSIHCVPKGHHNGDLFPGYEREWEEE